MILLNNAKILYPIDILSPLILIGLTLAGVLSPLLTFAAFWQRKEWRWDRMREHLGREGILLLFGKIRLLLLAAAVIFLSLQLVTPLKTSVAFVLGVFAIASLAQPLLGRQRLPVWTSKALTLVGTAFLLNAAIATLLATETTLSPFLLFLLFAQPALVCLAWLIFWPLDRHLKQRTFRQAGYIRSLHKDLIVIGITGSVGKTTTKELLAHLLKNRNAVATPAHLNTEMGVARWLIRTLQTGTPPRILIVEMGAYSRGEIALLCTIARPTIGIVTFVGSQHLALFGSQEDLLKAKGELLESLPSSGHAFLNGDCQLCQRMKEFCRCPATFVGTGGREDMEAYDIEETGGGVKFTLGNQPFFVPIHGTHNVTNALLAVAVAEKLGMSRKECADRMKTFSPPHRTFEVRKARGVTILDDTHNSSAASFKAAIAWADTQPYEQKYLLTSGLIELGEEHARTHRELGGLAANVFRDVVFLNTKSAQIFAEGYGKDVKIFSKKSSPVPAGSLLVCVGRISPAVIDRLLPRS